MSVEATRIASLIEFCHQSARLRRKPTPTVSSHSLFSLYEHELRNMPGVSLSSRNGDDEDEDELWLSVERLHETKPPEVSSPWLQPWIAFNRGPSEEPFIREEISGSVLIDAGTHTDEEAGGDGSKASPDELISFVNYEYSSRVQNLFEEYVKAQWLPWATEEKKRLKTIRLYAQLFTLKQQLEGGIVETQLELVWGIGIGIWKTKGTTVSYPLIGKLVELSLNPTSSALEVRPREIDPLIQLDWYAAQDNPGVTDLEKAAKAFFGDLQTTFSPFDRSTYEPLLRTAVTHLEPNGVYWPSVAEPTDRTVPQADENLKVTDTWVLFARPRSNSSYLQDLERLKSCVENSDGLPPAVAAIVSEPDNENPEVVLPEFRGVSPTYNSDIGDHGRSPESHKASDLFFPKPYNDEQVRIIQLLNVYDGVVVQGPPGTGKTHTIANVISHFLANGQRVLVTSMKDPALGVLQDQLPDEIRPLAISLLTSEPDGIKKFEHSIQKIASEVQGIDRNATATEIRLLEQSIDALHGRMSHVDWDIAAWAKKNLSKITIGSENLDAREAAQEIIAGHGQYEWIPDEINITPEFEPKMADSDIEELREARRQLGSDIVYLDASLPQLIELPDLKSILQTHQDLSKLDKLKQEVESGDVPSLVDGTQDTIESVILLNEEADDLEKLRIDLHSHAEKWISVKVGLLDRNKSDLFNLLRTLGEDIDSTNKNRSVFISNPVDVPDGIECDHEILEAVTNLAEGRRPFGLVGIIGKSDKKKILDSIRILGKQVGTVDDWKHVLSYLELLKKLNEHALRWNALASELNMPPVEPSPLGAQQATELYAIFKKVEQSNILEQSIVTATRKLFPTWIAAENVITSSSSLSELKRSLNHYTIKNRLESVWTKRDQFHRALDGKNGPIISQILHFMEQDLGNPDIEDSELQARWSKLIAELSRVLGLKPKFDTVRRVTELVADSGAPLYANHLRQPASENLDALLPNNWRHSWKLRRLESYLNEIDAQEELKALSKLRKSLEEDLSRAYQDVVVKRTWLKLAENASPSIRASLQAYLGAIKKIGKGTGKRAVRYRQDARNAAMQANAAVPCWIMPHYRISESLPPELGCFNLVIVDEASQSDLTALPALLRAEKVLIVGDDKQVSPDGVGLEEEKIRHLMTRFLGDQVDTYRPQMSPDRSIYDLFKVVFAKSSVMLKEHFRCVAPIIEYSKREFYNHELRPLRLPKASERLDPPLIDVLLKDGYRQHDTNHAEAKFIVHEIKNLVSDDAFKDRSIGVVSLLADKQAYLIWEMLTEELGPELLQKHKIACGDARTFQGKERDIIFLSMVVAPNESRIMPLTRDAYAQRFNVAASRARDRMYLVRSASIEHLSEADKLRRSLIGHFSAPFVQDEGRLEDLRKLCESPFELEVYDALTERGYWVTPQVKVGQFRIDLVVEGNNDLRLAVECDGDKYHGPDKWSDDMRRQRILERTGWTFWRCFASTWVRRKAEMIDDLVRTLEECGIEPIGAECAPKSFFCEQRVLLSSELENLNTDDDEDAGTHSASYSLEKKPDDEDLSYEDNESHFDDVHETDGYISTDSIQSINATDTSRESDPNQNVSRDNLPMSTMRYGLNVQEYREFDEPLTGDPRNVNKQWIARSLSKIIDVEGPVIGKRACDIYLRSVGVKRMGHDIRATMTEALKIAISSGSVQSVNEAVDADVMCAIYRPSGSPELVVRSRGNRSLEEIPPSEIQFVARYLANRESINMGSEEHLRRVLEFFGLKRLTNQSNAFILNVLKLNIPYVSEALEKLN